MRLCLRKKDRCAALAVEAAFVYPVMLFCLLGLIIGGMGVFRYQQVCCQAREAARWACVRGGDYARFTDSTSPTAQQILEQAVWPMAAGMDTAEVSLQMQWIDQASGNAENWDRSAKEVHSLTPSGEYVTNSVRVTVTYRWTPNFLGLGSVYLTSTSEVPMAF